jgi:hypothetical protein
MPAVTSRRAARLTVAALCALLVTGCGGKTATSTAASTPSTTTPVAATTAAATTTTVGPMTGKELVWLEAIGRLHTKIDTVLPGFRIIRWIWSTDSGRDLGKWQGGGPRGVSLGRGGWMRWIGVRWRGELVDLAGRVDGELGEQVAGGRG